MAKAKKSNLFPIIACAILLLTAILTISMLATPLYKIEGEAFGIEAKTEMTAFEYLDEMNKADEDGKTNIQEAKEELKEAEEFLAGLKDKGLPTADAELALEKAKQPIMLYDSLTAVVALTAIAMVAAVIALVLAVLKKNKLAFIVGLVAAVLLLAAFAAACATTSVANAMFIPETAIENVKVAVIAPIVALVISLIGSLAGGGLLVLKRK